jgi:co-chaperonin GroES (HSP10)
MSETPDDRPRPTPRPRPGMSPRSAPRPRVAGSRREREESDAAAAPTARPASAPRRTSDGGSTPALRTGRPVATARPRSGGSHGTPDTATRRRLPALVLALALLGVLAAAGAGLLVWQRLNPSYVDPSIFAAARSGIEAVYAYDYKDSEGSVQGKLDVLTGDLRDQYEEDLTQGGIIDTYEQVSATTRYEVLDVGLQQVNDAQDTATLVVFGQYVVESVNSGTQPAPEGSECRVTPGGAQSCTQTVQVRVVDVGGEWRISELTLLTTS